MDLIVSKNGPQADSEEKWEEKENKVVNIDLQTKKKVKIRKACSVI
jgi:hypothetical protein